MKAYFTASVVGKRHYLKDYLRIIENLKKKDCEVVYQHIIDASEEDIRIEKKEDRLAFHSELVKKIRSCDFMVVEASFPSISVGYEISLGLHESKPILILYKDGDAPSLLAHHENDRLMCERYTEDTLFGIIEDFLNYIEGKQDSRFTFFITPQINSFLETVSHKQKLPKSVYLRKLIEREMKAS